MNNNININNIPKRYNQRWGIERFTSIGKAKKREQKEVKKNETIDPLLMQPIPKNVRDVLEVKEMLKDNK
jgi:hypothetical protein